jgi:hypothetical protein
MAAFRISFLYSNYSLVTFTNLITDYHWKVLQQLVEPLPRPIIWEGNCNIVCVRELAEALQQERDPCLEAWQDVVPEVEPLLERVDVVDDDAGRPAARLGDHGEDAREGEGGGDVPFLLDALEGTRGEEGQHEREGGDEELGQREDDGDLLEDYRRRAEGGQERHVLPPDVVRLVDEQVREPVIEAPPVDGLELDGVGAGGDLERELLAFGAVEEVYVLLSFLIAGGGDDLHLVPAVPGGGGGGDRDRDRGTPKRTARGGAGSALTGQVVSALSRREAGWATNNFPRIFLGESTALNPRPRGRTRTAAAQRNGPRDVNTAGRAKWGRR